MTASAKQLGSPARRETVSLMMQQLVARLSSSVTRPGVGHPMLRPTVFVPVRRGEDLTFVDVVARRV
jgi:hypothetical protein